MVKNVWSIKCTMLFVCYVNGLLQCYNFLFPSHSYLSRLSRRAWAPGKRINPNNNMESYFKSQLQCFPWSLIACECKKKKSNIEEVCCFNIAQMQYNIYFSRNKPLKCYLNHVDRDQDIVGKCINSHNAISVNPRPPGTFSVTLLLQHSPWIFCIKRPYVMLQMFSYGSLLSIDTKKVPSVFVWCHNVNGPSKFSKYSQSLTIYTKDRQKKWILVKNRRNMQFSRDCFFFFKISTEMLILINIPSCKHVSCQIFLLQVK